MPSIRKQKGKKLSKTAQNRKDAERRRDIRAKIIKLQTFRSMNHEIAYYYRDDSEVLACCRELDRVLRRKQLRTASRLKKDDSFRAQVKWLAIREALASLHPHLNVHRFTKKEKLAIHDGDKELLALIFNGSR
jgi:hypothetical protein